MPQDNMNKPLVQAQLPQAQGPQPTPVQPGQVAQPSQGKAPDPEKMLIQFLKELEQNVADLNERVDVLEQKENSKYA